MSRGGTSPIPWKRRRLRELLSLPPISPLLLRLASETRAVRASGLFILDAAGEPQPAPDLMAWGAFMQNAKRHVEDTFLGEYRVSTVFLGIDHSFGGGARVLWETCVFGGFLDGEIVRYTSRRGAEDGHHKMCAEVRESMQ